MKTMIVPDEITLMADEVNNVPMMKPDPKEPGKSIPHVITFVEWVVNSLTRDKVFGENYDALESRSRIKKVLMKHRDTEFAETVVRVARAGDRISFEDSDYKLMLKVIEKPTDGFVPHAAEQCLEFMRSIKDAKE